MRSHPNWLPTEAALNFLRDVSTQRLRADDVLHFHRSMRSLEAAGLIKSVAGVLCLTHTGREVLKLWRELESLLKKSADDAPHSDNGE